MAEYIDRKALGIGKCNLDVFENKGYAEGWNSAIEIIENAPAANVIEIKHGKWVAHGYKWRCSVCNCKLNLDGTPMENGLYFCPNCGAKMDGEHNER